jgi:hypothetical protein
MSFRFDSAIWRPLVAVLTGALLSVTVGIPGCARPTAPTATSPQESTPPSENDFGGKPSEAEVQEFAKGLIAAIESNDINKFNEFVDWNALLEQATSGIDVPADWRQGFQRGFLSTLAKPGSFSRGWPRLRSRADRSGCAPLTHPTRNWDDPQDLHRRQPEDERTYQLSG